MAAGSRYEHSHQELSANLAFMSREMFPLPAFSRLGQSTHADRRAKKCSHRDSSAIVVSLMSIPYRGKEPREERWHPGRPADGKWLSTLPLPMMASPCASAEVHRFPNWGAPTKDLWRRAARLAARVACISGGTFPRERVRIALAPRDFISLPSGLAVPEIAPRVYTQDALSGRSDARRPANWDNTLRRERQCRKSRGVCTRGTRFLASGGWKEPPPSRITHRVYTRDGLFDRSSSRRSANSGNAVVGHAPCRKSRGVCTRGTRFRADHSRQHLRERCRLPKAEQRSSSGASSSHGGAPPSPLSLTSGPQPEVDSGTFGLRYGRDPTTTRTGSLTSGP